MTNALNLPGYRILDFKQNRYDYLYEIEPDEPPFICIHCGSIDVKFTKHSVRLRDVVDLPAQGMRVLLRVKHRRYKCSSCGETFYEPLNGIDTFAKTTKRLKAYIMEQAITKSYDEIGNDVGLSGQTVKRYFEEVICQVGPQTKVKAPRVLGIDEVYINKEARAVFTDIDNKIILEILPSTTKISIKAYIQSLEGFENIEAVTMDMCPAYRHAVKEILPKAKAIIDKYHVVADANRAMLKYYNALKNSAKESELPGLYGMKNILSKDRNKLTPRQIAKRDACLRRYEIVKKAYWLKEDLRDIYRSTDPKEAFEMFYLWESNVPKTMKHFEDLKKRLNRCKYELINYFRFPGENLTNAFTESINNRPKDWVRFGRHLSYEAIRAKVLLAQHIEQKPKIGELGFS